MFAKRELSENEYDDFFKVYTNLKTSWDPKKDEKLNDMYDVMEQNLSYLGCTAIEDKLQEGVADTIENLMKANIRLWVLTGDKQETAIEIAKSCKLIQEDMKEVILSSKSKEDFVARLDIYSE